MPRSKIDLKLYPNNMLFYTLEYIIVIFLTQNCFKTTTNNDIYYLLLQIMSQSFMTFQLFLLFTISLFYKLNKINLIFNQTYD